MRTRERPHLTRAQRELDARLWWTTVRPWLGAMVSWPSQHKTPIAAKRHEPDRDDTPRATHASARHF